MNFKRKKSSPVSPRLNSYIVNLIFRTPVSQIYKNTRTVQKDITHCIERDL